jgi:3-hydroxyisobutyrate dehydrogenase-like beta-hydroxyacid dehydrogenase
VGEHYGFIGLGNMGTPMASRLLDAGHTLTVYDVRADAIAPLVAKGARAAASAAAVASAAETVFVSLPTPAIVRAVALGPDGVASGNRVRTFVDLSTTGARMAQEIAAGLAGHEIAAIDAPVSGGVAGARAGTLAVMVSGPADRCAALTPALEVIGKVFYLGEAAGLGQTMKLCNNLVSAAVFAAACEAVVTGVKAGLDPAQMIAVLNASSGKSDATERKFPKAVLPGTFGLGFSAGLMTKDVKLYLDEAAALGLPQFIPAAAAQIWQLACTELGPDVDFTAVVKVLEKFAGVEARDKGVA